MSEPNTDCVGTSNGPAPDIMRVRSTSVTLSDDELIVLDGHVGEKAQKAVDAAKARVLARSKYGDLPPMLAGFVADVVSEAVESGELVWRGERLTSCPLCGRDDGYVTYKSGPRRGRPNYDKRKGFDGIDLARRFVRMEGHASLGGCTDCVLKALPTLKEALRPIPAQLPPKLLAGGTSWTKHANVRCTKCDWTGHEGEMGKTRTLMGDGWYPATCPSCGARNSLGQILVKRTDGHTMVAHNDAEATSLDHRHSGSDA